jgi:hypothetical protein
MSARLAQRSSDYTRCSTHPGAGAASAAASKGRAAEESVSMRYAAEEGKKGVESKVKEAQTNRQPKW